MEVHMKLVRVGKFGINFDHVAHWSSGIDPDQPTEHEILNLALVGGASLQLRDEQATVVRRWIEANSEDVPLPPTASADYVASQPHPPYTPG
jgi:hypothetical protein